MKRQLIALGALAATALTLVAVPAQAQWYGDGYHRYSQRGWNGQANNGWNRGWSGGGWNSRNVSDPSFGSRGGINAAKRTGRCVVDLGYGRYEYCGW